MRLEQPRPRGTSPFLSAAIAWVAYCAFASLPGNIPGSVAGEALREDALKAGYLYNFMKFVEWPPLEPADTFTVCFVGDSGVYAELASALPDKQLGTRRLAARRLASNESLSPCQVLYIDAGQIKSMAGSIGARPAALLTVSDAPGFLQDGGVIGLFAEGNRLRFRISLENARRANLRISSNLLQLASEVQKEG